MISRLIVVIIRNVYIQVGIEGEMRDDERGIIRVDIVQSITRRGRARGA